MSRAVANPQGNATSRSTTEVETSEDFTPPPAPPALDGVARRVWGEVWMAGQSAYNVASDSAVIERYASMRSRYAEFLRLLDTEGWTTVGSQGQLVAHPAAKLATDLEAKLQAMEDRLGLNPESRLRLGLVKVEGQSKLAAFLAAQDGATPGA